MHAIFVKSDRADYRLQNRLRDSLRGADSPRKRIVARKKRGAFLRAVEKELYRKIIVSSSRNPT